MSRARARAGSGPRAFGWIDTAATAVTVAVLALAASSPALAITPTSVVLEWVATGDNGNEGTASSYSIRYSATPVGPDTSAWWNSATPVAGPTPSPAGEIDTVQVNNLTPETTYWAMVITIDESGNQSDYSNVAIWTTPADSSDIIISNITNEIQPGVLGITIRWNTNIPATSQVEFGPSINYGTLTPIDLNLLTSHAVTLTSADIANDQIYNYRVRSGASGMNTAYSSNRLFKVDVIAPSRVFDLTAN